MTDSGRWCSVEVAGRQVAYREHGPPDGRPVLALHALASSAATWDRLARDLADRGRRVLAPDLRGHGRSPRRGPYTLAALHADAVGFLDALDLPRVDVVAHSLGARVATLLAVGTPDRVGRVVLEEPTPPAETAGPRPRGGVLRQLPVLLRARSFDLRATRPLLAELRTPDRAWTASLAALEAPVLLVRGAESPFADRLAAMARLVPDCSLVTVAGAGHRVHSTRPEEFAAAVLPFLRESPEGGQRVG